MPVSQKNVLDEAVEMIDVVNLHPGESVFLIFSVRMWAVCIKHSSCPQNQEDCLKENLCTIVSAGS